MSRGRSTPDGLDQLISELTDAALPISPSKTTAASTVWKSIARALSHGSLDEAVLQRWFGTSAELPPSSERVLEDLCASRPEVIGAAFERTAHLRLDGTAKRDAGMYYTPLELADFVVERVIAALQRGSTEPSSWKLVDPAGGAGVFQLAAARRLATLVEAQTGMSRREALRWVVTNSLHSVDSDPLATAVARSLMVAEVGSAEVAPSVERRFITGDALLNGPRGDVVALAPHPEGVEWTTAFPYVEGSFDAVIGNPPWGTVKPAIREEAAHVDPGLLKLDPRKLRRAMAGRTKGSSRSSYAGQLKSAGFELQGKGEPELYLYFVELARTLVRPGGVVGLLIPSAMQRASGAAELRRTMFDEGAFDEWFDFVNSKGMFAIHKMFRFSAAVWTRGVVKVGIGHAKFGLTSVDEARSAVDQPPVRLSHSYLAAVSPVRLTVPDVRTSGEAELYARLHDAFPPLGSKSDAWNVRFRRELDMTNDSDAFVTLSEAITGGWVPHFDGTWRRGSGDVLRPVYEGRMVHQFDAAAKGWVSGHGRSARWDLLPVRDKAIRPQFLVPEELAARRKIASSARAAFCDVTGHANERTILAAVVPAVAVCGNKVPTCEFDRGHSDLPYMWTAIANSFVLDWIARRRVATTLNFFHWEELPFPRLDPQSEVGQFLACTARKLSNAEHLDRAIDPVETAAFRAAIDVAVLRLYGLDVADAALVLEDFPLLDRGQHELNRTVTRDTVLAHLAEELGEGARKLSELGIDPGAGPDRLDERLEWHQTWASIAYIPGEHGATQRRSA